MRHFVTSAGTAIVGLLLLGGCSAKDEAGGNTAVAATTEPAATVAEAKMPKPGLWTMTMSGEGMPRAVSVQACLGAPAPGANPFAPPSQPGQQCTTPNPTRTPTGYAIDISCKINGITVVSKGNVTGDFASSYKTVMETTMTGPGIPAEAQVTRTSTVEAKYQGACPADMKAGAVRQAG